MATQYPSLSELTQAMQRPGPGAAIEAGTQGLVSGIQTASSIQARKSALMAKLQELGIMQQQANTASDAEKAKFIDPAQFNSALQGQPVTAPVSANFADALTRMKASQDAQKLADERMRFEGDQNRLSREQIAAEGSATRKAAIDSTAQTSANAQFETAAKAKEAAHSWLPWETANEKTANNVYDNAARRAGVSGGDPVSDYLKQIGAKDTPANRTWAQSKLGK